MCIRDRGCSGAGRGWQRCSGRLCDGVRGKARQMRGCSGAGRGWQRCSGRSVSYTHLYLKEHVKPTPDSAYSYRHVVEEQRRLPLEEARHEGFRVAVSRSHQTPETAEHIRMLRQARPDLKIVEQGSSYKFCLLAEGIVDYYVRTSPTYEWDTAAGELILSEAGGETRSLPDNRPFAYNKTDLHNPVSYTHLGSRPDGIPACGGCGAAGSFRARFPARSCAGACLSLIHI